MKSINVLYQKYSCTFKNYINVQSLSSSMDETIYRSMTQHFFSHDLEK